MWEHATKEEQILSFTERATNEELPELAQNETKENSSTKLCAPRAIFAGLEMLHLMLNLLVRNSFCEK